MTQHISNPTRNLRVQIIGVPEVNPFIEPTFALAGAKALAHFLRRHLESPKATMTPRVCVPGRARSLTM
jgi:hypothetical protein